MTIYRNYEGLPITKAEFDDTKNRDIGLYGNSYMEKYTKDGVETLKLVNPNQLISTHRDPLEKCICKFEEGPYCVTKKDCRCKICHESKKEPVTVYGVN